MTDTMRLSDGREVTRQQIRRIAAAADVQERTVLRVLVEGLPARSRAVSQAIMVAAKRILEEEVTR